MNGLVKELGMGSEAVRLYWEKDPENGRYFLKGGKYQFVYGTGMAMNVAKHKKEQYPRYIDIDEASSFGIKIDWEVENESLKEEIENAKARKAKIDEMKGVKSRLMTPSSNVTHRMTTVEQDVSEVANQKLEAENEDLKARLDKMEAMLAEAVKDKTTTKTKTASKNKKTEGSE